MRIFSYVAMSDLSWAKRAESCQAILPVLEVKAMHLEFAGVKSMQSGIGNFKTLAE